MMRPAGAQFAGLTFGAQPGEEAPPSAESSRPRSDQDPWDPMLLSSEPQVQNLCGAPWSSSAHRWLQMKWSVPVSAQNEGPFCPGLDPFCYLLAWPAAAWQPAVLRGFRWCQDQVVPIRKTLLLHRLDQVLRCRQLAARSSRRCQAEEVLPYPRCTCDLDGIPTGAGPVGDGRFQLKGPCIYLPGNNNARCRIVHPCNIPCDLAQL